MRKPLLCVVAFLVMLSMAFGQRQLPEPKLPTEPVITTKNLLHYEALQAIPPIYHEPKGVSQNHSGVNVPPIGTVTSSAVTAEKIGEATNSYTFLNHNTNQLGVVPGVGGNGGSVAFIHRQNRRNCPSGSGMSGFANSGLYRYAYSTDGGDTWTAKDATTAGCYGKGHIIKDPNNQLWAARYPNAGLFVTGSNPMPTDLQLNYVGSGLRDLGQNNGIWDGQITGIVSKITGTYSIDYEVIQNRGGAQFGAYSLVQQHPDSLVWWYLARDFDPNTGTSGTVGNRLILNKGTYNPTTKMMTWTEEENWNFNLFAFDHDNDPSTGDQFRTATDPALAFAPDGQKGYIGFVADLVGGQDTVYSPVFMETNDGGKTWSAPMQVDMGQFVELREALQSFQVLDSLFDMTGNFIGFDTIPFLGGKATTAFNCEMEVDKNGNPHLLVIVGGASLSRDFDGDPSNGSQAAAGYSIYGQVYYLFDVTKDRHGDWNMLFIGNQSTFRGYFGNLLADIAPGSSNASEVFSSDPYLQVSRTPDGSKIFFSWTDTDTTNGKNAPTDGPFNGNNRVRMTNYAPNFLTRALDVDNMQLTAIENWTSDDQTWANDVPMAKTANTVIKDGTKYTLPTVIINLSAPSALETTNFFYFSDVEFEDADFTQPASFFHNCKDMPFSNNTNSNDANCGMSDGMAEIMINGGQAPYDVLWGPNANNATTLSVPALPAGVYTVTVTDRFNCKDVQTVVVNNVGAPQLMVDPGTVNDPLCSNSTDGSATVNATGGTGTLRYRWDRSTDTTGMAMMLPGGRNILTVTDGNGCKSMVYVDLKTPPPIMANVSSTDVLCKGDNNGIAEVVSAFGGTGKLAYSWSHGPMTARVTGLAPGQYIVTTTDDNQCKREDTVDIAEPTNPLAVQTTTPTITNGVCRVRAQATGGTVVVGQPYAYEWVNLSDPSWPHQFSTQMATRDTLDTYEVTVTDNNNCISKDTVVCATDTTIGIAEDLAGIDEWSLYPNPTEGQVRIDLALVQADQVRLVLHDLHGRVLMRRDLGTVLTQQVKLDLSDIVPGMYFVKVTTSKASATKPLMVK